MKTVRTLIVLSIIPLVLSGCLFGGNTSKQAAADKLLKQGVTLQDKHEYSGAMEKYLEASNVYPDYYKPYIQVAKIYELKGQDEKALEVLIDALKVSDGQEEVSYEIAAIYYADGDFENAKKYLDKAVKSGSDESNLLMAKTLFRQNKLSDGAKYASRVDKKADEYEEAVILVALDDNTSSRVKSAAEALSRKDLLHVKESLNFYGDMLEKYKDDAANEAYLKTVYGYTLLKAGYPEAAISQLEPVATQKLEYFEPRLYLGVAYEQTNQNDKAVSMMQEAISLNPLNPVTYQVLGKVGFKQNNVSEFTTNYESAIAYSSGDERQEIRQEYVDRLEAKKLYTTAEAIYLSLIKDNPEDTAASAEKELFYHNALIAMLVLDAKEYDKALDYANKYISTEGYKLAASKLDEEVARYTAYMCGAYVEKSERIKGLELCDSALEKYAYSAVAYYYKGRIEYDLKKDSEAKEFLQRAVDLDITGEVSSKANTLLEDL